jgi:hypothetical protein
MISHADKKRLRARGIDKGFGIILDKPRRGTGIDFRGYRPALLEKREQNL